MKMNSIWAALRNPAFRKLWFAAVISGTCMVAHESAATWMMNVFTGSSLLLLVLVYVSMALVRQAEIFFVIAALAGVGWTMSACELWLAAQRAMPSWARGRMNAAVIMISQGAMALGGVIWGSAGAIAGTSYASLGAAGRNALPDHLPRREEIITVESEERLCVCSAQERVSGPTPNASQYTSPSLP